MKEAAGEANITVITIVLIAIVLAVGTVIVNSMMNNTKAKACCNSIGGEMTASGNCKYKKTDGSSTEVKMSKANIETFCPEEGYSSGS